MTGPELDQSVDSLLDRTGEAMDRGDWDMAIQAARMVLRLDPGNGAASAMLHSSEFRSKRRDRHSDAYGRRHLSVLFADVVGSTELASSLDPEVTRDVLRTFQQACASVIESFEGFVAHFIGDGVLAIFGYPAAHEDDAVRAVLAARGILAAVSRLVLPPAAHVDDLAIRAAVHTGMAVIADMGSGGRIETHDVVGETPNLAARLQAVASPGSVVISDATHRLVRPWFETEEIGSHTFKGIPHPVSVYRVSGEHRGPNRLTALARPTTALVGREGERLAIVSAWEKAASRHHCLTISGHAGVGKTRLVDFARKQAVDNGGWVVTLQCARHMRSSPLYPIVDFLELIVGQGDRRARLAALSKWVAETGMIGNDALFVLASLLSIPWPEELPLPDVSPEQLRERSFEVILGWVHQLAGRRPLLLVLEDLHWADPSTLEWVRRLMNQPTALPVLLLLTSRGPFEELAAERGAVIELGPLGRPEIEKIVDAYAGDRVADDVRTAIVDRSDGVPLYALELTRMVGKAGQLEPGNDSGTIPLPPTLQDLLVARLDQFPNQLLLAQAVATIGTPVSASFLSALVDVAREEVQAQLEVLVDGHLLDRTNDVTGTVYQFAHVLQRDAAYHLQLNSRRRQLHRRIAELLRKQLCDGGEDSSEVLAFHYEQAEEWDLAAEHWYHAGCSHAAVAAHREAIHCYERALKLSPRCRDRLAENFDLDACSGLAQSQLATLGYTSEQVAKTFARALDLSQSVGNKHRQVPITYGLWAYYVVRADYRTSGKLAKRLTETAAACGTPNDLIATKVVLGYQYLMVGRPAAAKPLLEAGRGWIAPEGPSPFGHHQGVGALTHLAAALWFLGYTDEGRGQLRSALERVEELRGPSAPFTRAYVHGFAADFFNMTGEYLAATDHASQTMAIGSEFGFASWVAVGAMHLAVADANALDPDRSIPVLLEGIRLWEASGAGSHMALFLLALALAYRRAGALEPALDAVRRAINHGKASGERYLEAEQRRTLAELMLELTGNPADAIPDMVEAVRVARSQKARTHQIRALTGLIALGPVPGMADGDSRRRLQSLLRWFGDRDEPFLREARAGLEASR